jgi:predicted NBD/HSP70 family sugar kinase
VPRRGERVTPVEFARDVAGPSADLASTSAGHLFVLFRDGHVRTRRELTEATGLSRVTVTQRVDALIAGGYLREESDASSTGGRPPRRLVPDFESKTILAAALGATHGRVAVLDGRGAALAERAIESNIRSGPPAVLNRLVGHWKRLLVRAGRDVRSVRGIGIGVPGPVNADTGRLVRPPIMPGWDDFPIGDHVRAQLHAPVFVDNDANLMAIGESRRVYPHLPSLLFVKVGTGIGAGLVLNGRLFRGIDGGAGDIGHVKIPAADGLRCSCGLQGCLAAVASGGALARRLHDAGFTGVTASRDVVELVDQGDPDAISAVRDAGRLLGEVLATAVSLLNPSALVIGGDMATTHEYFVSAVREVLYQRTQPLALAHLQVSASQLGDLAGIVGAAEMVRSEIFAPAAIDAALAAG